MEETGIIRRLDALGRIVIPREFRKLNRIEVGDPLEMRALSSGEILIRKVDLSAQLKSVGAIALSVLSEHTDKPLGVCSNEEWLEFSGSGKHELTGEELSEEAKTAASEQKSTVLSCAEAGIKFRSKFAAFYPVFGETGVFGALVLFTDEEPDQTEKALMKTAARFTGKSMQKF